MLYQDLLDVKPISSLHEVRIKALKSAMVGCKDLAKTLYPTAMRSTVFPFPSHDPEDVVKKLHQDPTVSMVLKYC